MTYTADQLAELAGVSKTLVTRFANQGRVPGAARFGRAWSFTAASLRWMRKPRKIGAPRKYLRTVTIQDAPPAKAG